MDIELTPIQQALTNIILEQLHKHNVTEDKVWINLDDIDEYILLIETFYEK